MKAHLLYVNQDFDFGAELPSNHEDLVQDLELSALLQTMAGGDPYLYDVALRVMLRGLDGREAIRYRQAVLADCMAQPDVVRSMYAVATAALDDRRSVWGLSSRFPRSILAGAIGQLEALVARLKELRKIADDHGTRFRSAGFTALFSSLQQDLDDEYFQTVNRHLRQLRFRGGIVLSAQLGRDNSGVAHVLRAPNGTKVGWKERLGLGPRSAYSFTIPPRDEAGAEALADLANRGINLVADAAARSAEHISSYFTMLCGELGFYVGCLNLGDRLAALGQKVSLPEPYPPTPHVRRCSQLCDTSLVLQSQTPVVGNDLDADGKPLVIITGANSGGKSTFLRSVGIAQIMMQCGLFVTAESYHASLSGRIFTHFVRQEDTTMTSGRLDEELQRVSAIADQIRPGCLVLFNESFSSTNEREGSEIARHVVEALLDAGIAVCFVTHQYDFAAGFSGSRPESTLFVRAERGADGQRSYHLIEAEPLPTSFGTDLYDQIGGWLDTRPPVGAPDGNTGDGRGSGIAERHVDAQIG